MEQRLHSGDEVNAELISAVVSCRDGRTEALTLPCCFRGSMVKLSAPMSTMVPSWNPSVGCGAHTGFPSSMAQPSYAGGPVGEKAPERQERPQPYRKCPEPHSDLMNGTAEDAGPWGGSKIFLRVGIKPAEMSKRKGKEAPSDVGRIRLGNVTTM